MPVRPVGNCVLEAETGDGRGHTDRGGHGEAGWIEFDAPLQLLPWGRNVYTVLHLDDRQQDAVTAAGARRVEGTLDDVHVNLGMNRADVSPRAFIYVGGSLQQRLGATADDVLACRLRPAS